MRQLSETLNDGALPSWGEPAYPVPPTPPRKMSWREWAVLIAVLVCWYGGFYLYWHSILAALLLGSEVLFTLGVAVVFFSGEWIK